MPYSKFNSIIICILLMLPLSIYSQNKRDSISIQSDSDCTINSNDTISFEFKDNILIFRLGKYYSPQKLNPGYTMQELYDFPFGHEHQIDSTESLRKIRQLYASTIGFEFPEKDHTSHDIISVIVSPNGNIIYVCLTTGGKDCYNLHAINSFLKDTKKIKFPSCQIYTQYKTLANRKF